MEELPFIKFVGREGESEYSESSTSSASSDFSSSDEESENELEKQEDRGEGVDVAVDENVDIEDTEMHAMPKPQQEEALDSPRIKYVDSEDSSVGKASSDGDLGDARRRTSLDKAVRKLGKSQSKKKHKKKDKHNKKSKHKRKNKKHKKQKDNGDEENGGEASGKGTKKGLLRKKSGALHPQHHQDVDDAEFDLESEYDIHQTRGNYEYEARPSASKRPSQLNEIERLARELLEAMFGRYQFVWLFLLVLTLLAGSLGAGVDWAVTGLTQAQAKLMEGVSNFWVRWVIWGGFMWACSILAIAAPAIISNSAVGSGIPEMKCILSGARFRRYLSFPTLVAKIISIVFSVGSGLIVGKVGPFAHVCSMLVHLMSKLVFFQNIRDSPSLYHHMLAVGCGLGLVTTLGSPIGGVLFSIETTSTYYAVSNYTHAFLASIMAAVIYAWLTWKIFSFSAMLPQHAWVYLELIAFIILGLVCGVLSAFFTFLVARIRLSQRWLAAQSTASNYAKRWFFWAISHPYTYAFIVINVTIIITFPGLAHFQSLRSSQALKDLFSNTPLDDPKLNATDWLHISKYFSLSMFFFSRFIGLAFSCLLPIACGLYSPFLAIGAALGRLTGELVDEIFPDGMAWFPQDYLDARVIPAGYAMVGAAAFAGGASHTLSSAVVLMEITGQLQYALPLLVGTAAAILVNKRLSLSIYDKITQLRVLPFMPDFPYKCHDLVARDIMQKRLPYFSQSEITPALIARVLSKTKSKAFPVVESENSKIVIGYVKRGELFKFLQGLMNCIDREAALESSSSADDLSAAGAAGGEVHTPRVRVGRPESVDQIRHEQQLTGLRKKRKRQRMQEEEKQRILGVFQSSEKHYGVDKDRIRDWEQSGDIHSMRIRPASFQVLPTTPLMEVHMLFIMLRLQQLIVSDHGRLKGLIFRERLKRVIGDKTTLSHRVQRCANWAWQNYCHDLLADDEDKDE
eukprot:TRINITY_DN5337_c0_g1_i2.p1 TRINITY_DN5337_c0_g1~~TRINITY_DN5337_c0_g1_i2.p1  ORF type:complete len:1058 (+),score=157.48 TRINITY_DN5337_c0_g1_i2:278-3175(+)